jgi:hypothetical protein
MQFRISDCELRKTTEEDKDIRGSAGRVSGYQNSGNTGCLMRKAYSEIASSSLSILKDDKEAGFLAMTGGVGRA